MCLGVELERGEMGDFSCAGLGPTPRNHAIEQQTRGIPTNLRDWHSGNLAIGHLRLDWSSRDLTIACLRRTAATVDDLDVDWAALSAGAVIVEVVEGTTQALVKDSVWAERKSTVAADSPALVVNRSLLDGVVELELVVGSDVANAAFGVLEVTVLEGEHQGGGLSLFRWSVKKVSSRATSTH